MCQLKNNHSKLIAIIFILISIVCVISSFFCCCLDAKLISISAIFATLAGALLVFSNLDLQRKALEEEIENNKSSHFDSWFYPILSSFRVNVDNIEVIADYIEEKKGGEIGREKATSYRGEHAFSMARRIIEGLTKFIVDKSLAEYNSEDFKIELSVIIKQYDAIDENPLICPDVIDKIENEIFDYIHSNQGSYLLSKYEITKDIKQKYANENEDIIHSFLLNRLLERQPSILAKYIQTLRFIIHNIEIMSRENSQDNYFKNVSCLMSKEEKLFLKCFKEFDKVTEIMQ